MIVDIVIGTQMREVVRSFFGLSSKLSRARKSRSRRVFREGGFAIAVAVIGLILLGIGVFAMLFFSGSQSRSLQHDLAQWQARENAMSGLKIAGEKLREGRWYGGGSLVGNLIDKIGGGGYVVVCEDMRRFLSERVTYQGKDYDKLALLDRVDVFSRGHCGKRTSVLYARFIMCPEPAFMGKSTDGLVKPKGPGTNLVETKDTLKRLVRITELTNKKFQNISQKSVRDAIRWHISEKSIQFVKNYENVRWDASEPSGAATTTISDIMAESIMDNYWGASSPNAENQFLRDRLYDLLVEGTPIPQRANAPKQRSIELEKDPPSGNKSLIIALCQATGTPVVEPNPRVSFPAPKALDELHSERGTGVGDSEYHEKLSYNPKAQVSYKAKWGSVVSDLAQAQASGATYASHGGKYYLNVSVMGPEDVTKPYWIKDPATGSDLRVDDVLGFFEKYFREGTSEPLSGSFSEAFDEDKVGPLLEDDSSIEIPGTPGSSWEKNPEIVIVPGPPEPLPGPTSGNTKGEESVGNVIHVSTGGSGGGGSAAGGW